MIFNTRVLGRALGLCSINFLSIKSKIFLYLLAKRKVLAKMCILLKNWGLSILTLIGVSRYSKILSQNRCLNSWLYSNTIKISKISKKTTIYLSILLRMFKYGLGTGSAAACSEVLGFNKIELKKKRQCDTARAQVIS